VLVSDLRAVCDGVVAGGAMKGRLALVESAPNLRLFADPPHDAGNPSLRRCGTEMCWQVIEDPLTLEVLGEGDSGAIRETASRRRQF
jgi:hypothetical protein